jgi:hypothetical protein
MAKAKTIADFRTLHDMNVIVPNKIRAALESMLKEGPEQWDYEGDFIKRAGISTTQVNQFRDQFTPHVIEAGRTNGRSGRRVWVADAKIAKKLRGE